jgi:pyruvate dehydrogenase E2 component (dihydrolipoamide acetyltransferase)
MPPQVAILGVGRIGTRPVRTLPLSLSFDHRAVTGGEAARFLRAVIDNLEKPT